MHMNLMKRMLSLLLALALLMGNIPAAAFAEETEIPAETEIVAAEETLAPTEAVTEPAASTEAATEPAETVTPTEVVTEPAVEETIAPTQPAVPEETVAPTEPVVEETVVPTESVEETIPIETAAPTEAVTESTPEETTAPTEVAADLLEGTVPGEDAFANTDSSIVASGNCGEKAKWSLNASGVLTISGTGKMKDYWIVKGSYEPWHGYGEVITTAVIEKGITRIGDCAFYECRNLQSVVIPDSVKTVGSYAFARCENLLSIELPDEVTSIEHNAFFGCSSLAGCVIPDGVTSIEISTFDSCTSMTSVKIPNSVTKIKDNAFSYCSSLENIDIPSGVTSIGESAFSNCSSLKNIKIPSGVTSINKRMFANCTSLISIDIPENVTEIGMGTFDGCSKLASIEIPDSINTLDITTFRGCESLSEIVIPSTVRRINSGVFAQCSGLKSIWFEGHGLTIAENVFQDVVATAYYPTTKTTWLEDLMQDYGGQITWTSYVPEGSDGSIDEVVASGSCGKKAKWKIDSTCTLTISGKGAITADTAYPWHEYEAIIRRIVIEGNFEYLPYYAFHNLKKVTSVSLGNKLETIGEYAFAGCDQLTEITIPKNVIEIYHNVFENCTSLANLNFEAGSKLRIIGECAFYRTAITELTTPASLNYIEDRAFSNCKSLRKVSLNAGLKGLGWKAFSDCTNLRYVYIPQSHNSTDYDIFAGCYALETIENYGILYSSFEGRKKLKSLVWAGNAKVIEPRYFEKCTALTEVVIGEKVTVIEANAFNGCTALAKVNLPSKLKVIHQYAFASTGIINLKIPGTVEQIKNKAFNGSKLETLYFDGKAPVFETNALAGITAVAFYHSDDPSWTEEKLQNFGGNITWLDVSAHEHNYTTVTVHSTCTEAGYSTTSCAVCGQSYISDETEPLGHAISETTRDATCTDEGEVRRKCDRCDYCEILPIDAFGHDMSQWEITKGATFTQNGEKFRKCNRCEYSEIGIVEAFGLPKPVVNAEGNSVTGGGILTWEHDGEADYYKVYRATSKSGKYKLLETVEGTELEVKVSVGKTYYYKVKAICDADSDLSSGYSSVVKVTGKCAQPEIDVAVKPSSGKPVVKWSKISGAKKYDVYRATEIDGTYKKVKTTTSTSYTDSKAELGTTYYYKVKAIASKSTYNSAFTEVDSCLTILAQPDAELSINKTTGKPVIEWEKVSGAVSYEILRAESEKGEYINLANQTELTFEDSTAEPDKDYWYKVNAIAENPALNSIDGDAEMIHATLAKPVVSFAVNSITGKPVMTWEEVDGAVEYKIYRSSKSKESYKCIETTTDLSYSDDSVKAGKGYYYKVIAIGENCKSVYSSYKKLTAKCAQPEITAIGADPATGKPYVDWDKVSGAKKYEVYRATEESGTYKKVKTTTSTSYTDSKAELGKTYYYKVKAIASKSSYNSIESEVESCLTVLARPVVTAKNDADTGKVILSWEKVDGAVGYEIYCSVDEGEFAYITTQSELTYTDESAVVDGKYTYKVKAIANDPALNSAESTAETITAACAKPKASIALDGKKPMVSWDPVEGATKYYVYRSTKKSSGYKKVATVELEDGTSYRDSKAKKGTTYYYKIVAVSENAKSAYSNVVKIKSK